MATLCERLGGEEAIVSVVDKFYEYMLSDDRVSSFFKNTNMEKQRKAQAAFITMATGGPNHYQGADMKEAHAKFSIGHKEFDATWENLQKSLEDHKVKNELISEVKEVFYSVEEDVINKKE